MTSKALLLGTCRFLKFLFLSIFLGCILALLYLFLQPEPRIVSLICFSQWAMAGGCYYLIVYFVSKAVLEAAEGDDAFFRKQIVRLRIIALLVLGLSLIATLLSFIQSFLANGVIPSINFSILPGGFPDSNQWESAFSSMPVVVSTPSVASIDLGSLLAFAMLWGLSFAFEQGARLQEDSNLTL